MMRIFLAILVMVLSLPALAETKWHWDKGTIVVDTPVRPEGQKTALGLTRPALPVVRVGFVGLGMRGPGAVKRYTYIPGTRTVALCDVEKGRVDSCQQILTKAGFPEAAAYTGPEGYKALCERSDIDLVYVATDWLHHVPVAKYALTHGKNVAIEVPSAMNLQDCWDLVNLAEQKQLHCIILENCLYDFFEMNTLNMAQQGVFGEILHVEGAYIHCLDPFWPLYWKNWRMNYNQKMMRGDVYPTHGLGPVAQLLNIHRGDRMKTLVAMDTKAVGGLEYVKANGLPEEEFRQGDHTTTLIRTEQGKVIEIQHDVMNPQPYNRKYQLTGSRGFANKYPVEGYALSSARLQAVGVNTTNKKLSGHEFLPQTEKDSLVKKYKSPIIDKYEKMAKVVGGHGGMDYIMDSRIVYCLQNGLPMDMDVYDLAEWCSLAELGTLSMDNNNASVQVPDFTRGHCYDKKCFRHAFATPEQEERSAKMAAEYTATLKEKGVKAAEKLLKKLTK